MGFDNECILNIQSLAGEYFCPVCRLLVYPNEALQSQCTHLYCKPCLSYVVSTTRACPYDGYLVTEADSKPLSESNKALAETIGKITVYCLYHRSGCTWQGPLSECTSHCSECAFGNSPVVCNRCGVQIVHRQVQEHAQNCPGVQPQAHAEGAKDAAVTGTPAAGDQNQAATQAATTSATTQTTASSTPGQGSNQQANPTTQSQPAVQAVVSTADQWYQQQQQYQQYYQQYPGYDPYQQHYQQYYPYQQQAVPQCTQSQVYMQPQTQVQPQAQLQTQAQSHPQVQLPAAAQPQSQGQVNPQQQTHTPIQPQSQLPLQTHAPPHGQPPPQAQLHQQTNPVQQHPQHIQLPQYQQPHSQMQHPQSQVLTQAHSQLHPQHPVPQSHPPAQGLPQTHAQYPMQPIPQPFASQPNHPVNPHVQPQPQHSSAHAVTGHHSYPQPQPQQQLQLGGLQHPVHYAQGGPQPQFPQQSPLLRPPQSHVPVQNPQQSGLLPSPGQVPNVPPAQQQPVQAHAQQPGLPVHQLPVMQSVQQPIHQQYVQQQPPFPGQALGPVQNQVHQQGAYMQQHLHGHSQLRPQGPSHAYTQPLQNVPLPHGTQAHQAQNLGGRPPYGVPTYPHPHSSVGMQVRPMQVGADQQSGNAFRANNQMQLSSEQPSGAISRPTSNRQGDDIIEKSSEADSSSQKNVRRDPNDLDVASGLGSDVSDLKTVISESNLKPVDDDNKSINEVKEEPKKGNDDQKDISNTDNDAEDKGVKDGPVMKNRPLPEAEHLEDQSMKSQRGRNVTPQHSGGFILHGQVQGEGLAQPSHSIPIAEQGKQQPPVIPHGPSALQQRPIGSSLLTAPPPGSLHHGQIPGHPSARVRPLGPGHIPHGPEVSSAGMTGLGSTPITGRGGSHYGLQGTYTQGHALPSQADRTPYGHDTDMFANQRPNYTDGKRLDPLGQQSGMHSNAMRMNGAPGMDSSSALGLRDDRFRPFSDEYMNPFPKDPSQRIVDRREFEEDLKHFSRPSDLDTQSTTKFGANFSSSRPLDRGPLDKGLHGPNYDSGMKLESLGGPPPSRFFPPYHHDGLMHPNDIAERSIGFHDNTLGRQPDSVRAHPEFFGPGRRYDRRHRDGMAPRSPGRDYPGVSSRGFGAIPGLDDIDGRESRRFGDSFHGSRFPVLPSHMLMGEFEGPSQDGFSNHFRRGEHLGHHNMRNRLGEPIGFGAFPGPAGMGDLSGTGNFFNPRLGEPGFRSSFSFKGFPGDGGIYAGELESFDNSRRRKSSSMGWCRICKVDCETVEGLDLHSQTREHQKRAMDMVVTIKQNAKKQKLANNDHSSVDDASKSKNTSIEGRGNKN
ncbi:mediator of RNA polymerase II transcription subunit 12 [Ricinus communis]|uniref:mediator of RNA polymerase II transcription subunit 12 n=1 Tax=Ricinus communis TaxID=3988 RepID=UPI00201A400A|nr:mediator of RNA polymerase II transcription subunit 12 [Ricinus communis]XP_015575503.2 mediator of RNA polymerase II transcription subunit 12 [Ricinus communis]XP_048230082.1 mediator of RNA polymerase II transcription subunit 12 [Ricinus communis]XP_048230084.1 mediator of RNA polymerase II transcription subunit 12 [Ricinus communis]XP_048230085.1 mediator of RNA polymerase II transcription subunit 12 [Ricinus communis]XP_048230088.1 mediator of RNA polymerase II transcription subunit 12 